MRLKDKVAIVTGAGRGIGLVTAQTFAREGAKVALCDLDLPEVQAAAEEIRKSGGQAVAFQANTGQTPSVQEFLRKVLAEFGRVDILVNNAGIIRDKQLLKMEEADFDAVIEVNLKGVYLCTRHVAEVMAAQGGGVILNASSVVALYGNFGQTNYVASKAGVIGMTKVWARELGRKGIRVNAVAPGFIETRMTEGIPDKVMEQLVSKVPLGRMGKPQDIANAYLWLASDEASYVTGHVLSVDGGAVT
ncbi:MAG: 3-oxoacyl-ACP reductase FabG [Candidatus Eremiobacteraeota bacterium]|nr:3-oxoacyl-ACP reductase FabG [Candidatus Eremiobacteraeota bacterium]MCW5869967.1 3-oxoacyl-ACP reductase FabG [Candidatus Eremiobacteraeota bacterium]